MNGFNERVLLNAFMHNTDSVLCCDNLALGWGSRVWSASSGSPRAEAEPVFPAQTQETTAIHRNTTAGSDWTRGNQL